MINDLVIIIVYYWWRFYLSIQDIQNKVRGNDRRIDFYLPVIDINIVILIFKQGDHDNPILNKVWRECLCVYQIKVFR